MITNIELSEAQMQAWVRLIDHKEDYEDESKYKDIEVVLYGGQKNSGKSYLGCLWLLNNCLNFPGSQHALCRRSLKELKASSLKTFYKVCKENGVKKDIDFKYNNQTGSIQFKNGSEITLVNLAWEPSDPTGDRFGGFEPQSVLIEEVGNIPFEYFKVMYGCIRDSADIIPKKMLCTCNPTNNWIKSFFYDRYIDGTLPPEIEFINTVGKYNPFRGKDYEKKLGLLDESFYKRIEGGDWDYASTPDQLFKPDKLEDIFTPLQHGKEEYTISADVARFGEDSTIIILWLGLMVVKIIKLDQSDLVNTANEITKLMNEYKIPRNKIIVDDNGVGGGVTDQLKCKGFVNNARPIGGEKYFQLKDQCYFKLSQIRWSISDKIEFKYKEQTKRELESIRDESDEYKYKINSKDEQKKLLGGKSPDFSDAIMMRMYLELTPENKIIMDFGFR